MRSGASYYVSGLVMKEKGPFFVTAFNPLGMVIVAIISSFALAERLVLGRYENIFIVLDTCLKVPIFNRFSIS